MGSHCHGSPALRLSASPEVTPWLFPKLQRRLVPAHKPSGSMSVRCACPLLHVEPTRALVDEKICITVRNLLPAQKVTLHSLHQSEDKDFWEAFGHYVSDAHGCISVGEQPSVGGTYEGTEPMGLLWSMKPVPESKPALRLRKKDVCTPMVLQISLYAGHLTQGFQGMQPLACAVAERWYLAPGVRRMTVQQDGVAGTLFVPPGSGPFPGVLDIWGGGGGLVEYRSALLASHGYVSLALEYISPGMFASSSDVDLKYFETAFKLLQDHPLVVKDRVAVIGLSFGTTVALSLAAYSEVQPKCVVCISGSHVYPIKTSIRAAVEYLPSNVYKVCVDENNHLIWRNIILPITTDPDLKTDMQRIKCPLMLINGEDDQNWATKESAEDMKMLMENAGNSDLLTISSYPGAGHLIEPPYSPHFRFSNFVLQPDQNKVILLWGGYTKPHAHAQEDSWEKILAFLENHLYSWKNQILVSRL